MKMQLMSLTLDHFKGFDHREFQFEGKNAVLYGDNAAGKTTVYDALTWLLFGKDSQGRTGFEIKPLFTSGEHQGEVKDHAAVTSVEAALLVNGAQRRLKRSCREVWTKKRGSSEAAFDGHASEFTVDGVPVKKSEFAARVGEIISEDRFRLLTSISYFASAMPWQSRREVLFDLAGVGGDREIMATDRRFEGLAQAMGDYGLEDYRRMLSARRKGLSGVRNDIPARLDELDKSAQALSGTDFEAAAREREAKQSARDALKAEIEAIYRDSEGGKLDGEIMEAAVALQKLEAANAAHRQSQRAPDTAAEESGLRRSLDALAAADRRRRGDLAYLRQRVAELERESARYRQQQGEIEAEAFHGALCPTCGQQLPQDKLEAAAAGFARDKEQRKAQAEEAAQRAEKRRRELLDDAAKLEQEQAGDEGKAAELRGQLDALAEARAEATVAAVASVATDLPGFEADKAELEARLADLRSRRDSQGSAAALRRKVLYGELSRCEAALEELTGELAKRAALEDVRARMEQLRAQADAAAAELEELDKTLGLIADFARYKVRFIEQSINRRFELVRFRLFREQINGGVEDCCDVTVDGVPYDGGLNNGARINAGVDIINALSRHYDAHVPLFVDNAEGVTKLERADTQVIRLVVSGQDKQLRCELG